MDCHTSDKTATDKYLYCAKCIDYVYEYCSVHGPYLVIPDDKVSSKPKYPSFVPRAALTIPSVFLHVAPSTIPGAGVGVFSTVTLPRGVRFGPYRGQRTQQIGSTYCWQIYDRNRKPSHVVDAADPNNSNWMRYVNCARHWCEENLVAYQYRGQLYYRTIKLVPPFTELLVFYGIEYANTLNIDLRKYNYERASTPSGRDMKETIENVKNFNCATLKEVFNKRKECKMTKIRIGNEYNTGEHIENISDAISQNNISENSNTWVCVYCNRVLSKNTRRREHYATHAIKYRCDLCPFKTKVDTEYKKHIDRHTQGYIYICDMCYFISNTYKNLKHHKKRIHKTL